MMEVKQNTAVDLNDLLASSKSSGTDEIDDAVMTDLSDRTDHGLVSCDIIKANEEPVVTEAQNGDAEDMSSLIKDIDDDPGVDLNNSVNTELEDALLAEDDILPEIPTAETIQSTLSATDDILTEKAETSNSTTSSNNVRDPGDDLDTLLSKINDIVEDCIENEKVNTVDNAVKADQSLQKELGNTENKIEQCSLEVDEPNVAKVANLVEEGKSEAAIDKIDKSRELMEETENLFDNETSVTPDLDFPLATPELPVNEKEVTQNEKDASDIEENNTVSPETDVNNDSLVTQSTNIDNSTENNVNPEKTDESKEEMVQDSKISSNSNEIVEDANTEIPMTVDNDEKISSPKAVEETNTIHTAAEDPDETFEKAPTETEEKTRNEKEINSEIAENEDSDDEIVFYVDKPPEIENSKETEEKSVEPEVEINKVEDSTAKKELKSPAKKEMQDDDDVVLLLDDDDEEVNQTKNNKEISVKNQDEEKEPCSISTVESVEAKQKDIVIDNSDNALDDFAIENSDEKENSVKKTENTETPEETNSNCSNSSNLLQEAKSTKIVADESTPEEAENEEEEDDGDVELIISELKEPEALEKIDDPETPPAKRIRLSEDGEKELKKQESGDATDGVEMSKAFEKKQESLENSEPENNSSTTLSALKRSHDVIELEADEKSNGSIEGFNKKPKKDVIFAEKLDENMDDKLSDDIQIVNDDKKDVKAVPSYEPIRLYPAPKFGVLKSDLPMSLEYLKKFRKSFDNMTKQDLEELVLQKVVEAIIHRSEFSEMRELIEKQEKLISAHRTKISELSKQFRDLEMVHNRVVKDIEQRNSQFIMPVKITRAVGLQVYIPNKKSLAEATSSSIGNIPTSPQRPISSQASSTSSTSLTPPQRQFLSSQTDQQQQRSAGSAPSLSGSASSVRRGCVQKITPIRPVPGVTQSSSAGPSTTGSSASYRSTQNHAVATQPRILNKGATTNANSTAIQRARYSSSSQDGQRMSTQPISRTPNVPANSQRVVPNATIQSKPTSTVVTAVPRRSESLNSQSSNNSSNSIVDNYLNTLTHLTGGNTAVSITPAKPKEKAVIDLTDEDEAPVQSSGSQTVTPIPGTQVQRRSLPPQNSSSSQLQHGRAAPTMTRVPPASQMASNKNRQLSSLQGAQKNNSFTSISTPPGTSITRINVAPNTTSVQRAKYSHPAPLPATPPQAFNPSWKLPPPRPTIRISNLDNGIVISWTMEESMDRHAECVSYQIYAYQETSGPPMVDSWRHVGDVKAMLLPMAVTLTQFQEGQRYYFAVRAVDCHQRYGPFSLPKTWS